MITGLRISLPVLLVVAVFCGGELRKEPLVLEDEPAREELVEVDEPKVVDVADADESSESEADNSRCHVCHLNYAMEDLAVNHAGGGVSCEQCHGSSDAHCSDEDNITPPDIMWPLTTLNSSCMEECHPKEAIDIEPHQPILSGTPAEEKVCTDCHGDHRLGHRTRRWNRTTGELVHDDNVRMLTDEERETFEKK